jgi:hypothetical protein
MTPPIISPEIKYSTDVVNGYLFPRVSYTCS